MGEWRHPEHYSGAAQEFTRATRAAEIEVFERLALPRLIFAARQHGYALAVHGSRARDLDLIAVPWTELAADADALIAAVKDAASFATGWGHITNGGAREQKPHGRVAVTILASPEVHIDLSVMPRLAPAPENPDHG